MALSKRPNFKLVGASCHSVDELSHAEKLQMDFAVVGPVAQTASHSGQAGLGWARFAELVQNRSMPVFAIGGMSQSSMIEAWRNGAHGIAAIRSAWTER
jgi:8-oxo-dGTP diphosphatase